MNDGKEIFIIWVPRNPGEETNITNIRRCKRKYIIKTAKDPPRIKVNKKISSDPLHHHHKNNSNKFVYFPIFYDSDCGGKCQTKLRWPSVDTFYDYTMIIS